MRKSEKGFGATGILLVLLVLVIVGGAGYLVWKKSQDETANTTTSTQQATNTADTVEEDENALPDDWATYEVDGTGVKFGYPEAWGAPSVQKEQGYSVYDYDDPKSDGTATYTVVFADEENVAVSLTSTKYINGPHGGATTYGIVTYSTDASGKHRFVYRGSEDKDGDIVPVKAGNDVAVKGTVSKIGDLAIYVKDEPECNESGCPANTNILIVAAGMSSGEFASAVAYGTGLDKATAEIFAKHVALP